MLVVLLKLLKQKKHGTLGGAFLDFTTPVTELDGTIVI